MTLGEEIIEGLTELCEVAESGQPLSERFEVRTVKVPRQNDVENLDATEGVQAERGDAR